MNDDNSAPLPLPGELPRPVLKKRRASVFLIWLVPVLAALIGVSLVVGSWMQAGPEIEISFQSAQGLAAGKTPVKYKDVVIGKVEKIRLSADRSHVLATVALEKSASSFATVGTRFWVVRPRIGLGGVSGVDTLFSGAYIGADTSEGTEPETRFDGLENPPPVTHGEPGRSFVLHAADLGSLDIGSPVYYRLIQVGRVVSYQLDADGEGVTLGIFVDAPNDRYVSASTRFWNASGVNVTLGANGLKLDTQSLATVIAGGVAFQDPPGPHDDTPAAEGTRFELFGDEPSAMAPPDGEPRFIRMRFEQSVRGLAVDAPVEFLGINVGKVVSVRLDYDAAERRFPVQVGALIYPGRLGAAWDKLAAAAAAHGRETDMGHLFQNLVEHGLRAQARTGNLLTGQLYVALDFVPNAARASYDPAARPLLIPTAPGSFDKLQEQMADVVDKLSKVPFDSIGRHLDRSLAGLDRTLQRVDGETLPALKDTLHGVDDTLRDARGTLAPDAPGVQQLNATLQQLERMARSLRVLGDYLGTHPEALLRGRGKDAPPAPPAVPAPKPVEDQP